MVLSGNVRDPQYLIYSIIPDMKGFISPRSYVQGANSLSLAGKLLRRYGKKAMVFAGRVVMNIVREQLSNSLEGYGVDAHFGLFNGILVGMPVLNITWEALQDIWNAHAVPLGPGAIPH